jgi:hypothetical protein
MSYKYKILADYPIAYLRSDDLSINPLLSYQDVIDEYPTYQDFENAFPNYKAAGTNLIEDSSPCNNDGGYSGLVNRSILPVVAGEQFGMQIDNNNSITVFLDNDYNGAIANGGLGTKETSDNDFSLEAWVYPSFITTNLTPIIADSDSNIGLFYINNNLIFRVNDEVLEWTCNFVDRLMHIVCVYNRTSIFMYVNGILVRSNNLNNFYFSNTSLNLMCGPTLDVQDKFLINGIAIYRYGLSSTQISNHYVASQPIPAIQIVYPDGGELFQIYDNSVSTQYKKLYPLDKGWSNMLVDGLYYDNIENSLSVLQLETNTAVSKEIIDYIILPTAFEYDSSKIEWDGSIGIEVWTSVDGTTYVKCTNGMQIPQYEFGSFNTSNRLYVKIKFITSNASKYVPKINNLSVVFYNDQTLYADNSGSYISTLDSGNSVFTLGDKKYPVLSKNKKNGLKTKSGSGFNLHTSNTVSTIEFFYTPKSLGASALFSTSTAKYQWNSAGVVDVSNISAIYVNGVNFTAQGSALNIFNPDEIHHVCIVLTTPITGDIKFNQFSGGAVEALFQNIAIYPTQFNSTKALEHYALYTNRAAVIVDDSPSVMSLTLTEDDHSLYDNDWIVVQSS